MTMRFFPANKRGFADHGWLRTFHSFSFAHFYDPDLMGFGTLRVVNDDWIAPNAGFPEHPHSEMEIVTIPLSGAVRHLDSSGGEGVVRAGEVQVMSAGTGVFHSEFNASSTDPLTLFQIWIEPKTYHIKPRYEEKSFPIEGQKNQWQLLVSGDGHDDSLVINQNACISLGDFELGEKFSYTLVHPKNKVFLLVVEGRIEIEKTVLDRRDALGISDIKTVKGKVLKKSELLLIEIPPMVSSFPN